MSPDRNELLELCAGYALGSLDEADRRSLEAALASQEHPELEPALAAFAEAAVLLAQSAPAVAPPAALKARVMAAVAEAQRGAAATGEAPGAEPAGERPRAGRIIELRPRRVTPWAGWAWAAVAAALAVASGLAWLRAAQLRDDLDASRRQIAELRQHLTDDQHWLEVLNAPGARVAEMQITPAGVKALRARATFDPRTRSAVLVFENFRAPEGHDYQLWALQGGGVASLGLIKADESGRAVLKLERVGDPATLAGFAVSLEPEGGSPNPSAPTGPVVMAGKFGG